MLNCEPIPKPTKTPTSEIQFSNPLQQIVCKGVNPLFNKIPTSPIYRGISWATTAIVMEAICFFYPVAKAIPTAKPSKKLWRNDDRRFKYPEGCFPFKS